MSADKDNQDWDKDKFPTSARPIFRGVSLLVLLLACLCAFVYFSSDFSHIEEEKQEQRQSIEDDFLADDQLID